MNPLLKKTAIASCAVLGALLTSCVDPYYGAPAAPTTVTTTYRTGYEVRTLPSGYRSEMIGGTRYYTHNGTYYRPRSGRYVVVDAPRRIDDRRYDRDRDRYDRDRRPDRDRYDNRRPVRRDVVITKLPPGYRVVNYRGADYYQVRDVYYQRRGTGYVVVTRPF